MNTSLRNMASRLLALLAALVLIFATSGAQAQPAHPFSRQELDQMLAPIALYPDALLSQILMAATYPGEVIEAARWADDRPDVSGDAAVRAAETEDWDPSVRSLLAFPQVLARMRENLQWTQALGAAFLEQQSELMETVQALRRKAQAAGSLHSNERLSVLESGPSLLLHPSNPEVVYVPYYDPLVVFGSWWWPTHAPVYLRPWPGYYARPAYAGSFHWGTPVRISAGFFSGAIDWGRREVRVVQVRNIDYRQQATLHPANANPPPRFTARWRHDPDRRRGPVYRDVDRPQRYGAANAPAQRATRPAPLMPPATRFQQASQPAAATQPAPTDRQFDRRREPRGSAQAAPPAAVMRPAPITQSAPAAQPAAAWHSNRQEARPERGARHEAPWTPRPRMEALPVQSAAHRETAAVPVARQEPAARHGAPPPSAARAEMRPPLAAARQEPGARSVGHQRMVP